MWVSDDDDYVYDFSLRGKNRDYFNRIFSNEDFPAF